VSTPSTPAPLAHGIRSRLNNSENKIPIYSNDTEYNCTAASTGELPTNPEKNMEEIRRERRARTFCWYFLQSSLTSCPRSNNDGETSGPSTDDLPSNRTNFSFIRSKQVLKEESRCPYLHLSRNNTEDMKYVQSQLQKIEKYLRYAAHCNVTYMSSYLEFITKYGKCLSEIESWLEEKK
jgi:hypothetical protein